MNAARDDDALLVARSLAGHRPAFAQIVGKYQSLVCAVAYSATGSLSGSEDLAQDAFLTAWRRLPQLREPSRLRAWLCGIVRHLASEQRRRGPREPNEGALPIDAVAQAPANDPEHVERVIRSEEQALLWRAIERIPEIYREPLVLYYREHHSIERVASALELSEDTVRQRLTRGRRLLHEEMLGFVEGALERSRPGHAFTAAVLAALPAAALSPAASAAVTAVGVAKGSALAKPGFAAAVLGLVGPLFGAVNIALGIRAGLDAAPTARERAAVWRQARVLVLGSAAFSGVLSLFVALAPRLADRPTLILVLGLSSCAAFAAWIAHLLPRYLRELRDLRAECGGPPRFREFRSTTTVLGWPLYHIRYGTPAPGTAPIRAWFAVGDRAIGGLFAMGHVAVAPVSVGVISMGAVCVGGVSAGLVPIATVALGILPLGGAAVGMIPIGGFCVGWPAAVGGLAIASDYAAGHVAIAAHANDAVARSWLNGWLPSWWLPALLACGAVLSIVPSALFAARQRHHLRNP